jgi:hypothetical protein
VPFRKDHNGHGRELLCQRSQQELRIGGYGCARVEIRKPENFALLNPPVADEQRSHSRRILLSPVIQQRVEARVQRLRMNADTPERGQREARNYQWPEGGASPGDSRGRFHESSARTPIGCKAEERRLQDLHERQLGREVCDKSMTLFRRTEIEVRYH